MDSLTKAMRRSAIAFVIVLRSIFQYASSPGGPDFRMRMRGGLWKQEE